MKRPTRRGKGKAAHELAESLNGMLVLLGWQAELVRSAIDQLGAGAASPPAEAPSRRSPATKRRQRE
jgi:hypothetical protein